MVYDINFYKKKKGTIAWNLKRGKENISFKILTKCIPTNDAATTTELATIPVALEAAANPIAPITGMRVPNVGEEH